MLLIVSMLLIVTDSKRGCYTNMTLCLEVLIETQ